MYTCGRDTANNDDDGSILKSDRELVRVTEFLQLGPSEFAHVFARDYDWVSNESSVFELVMSLDY